MKLNFRILILLTFFYLTNLSAQESIPVLTGKVEISISKGTFVCDLTLSEIPQIKDYFIRLNSGMNILYMKSKKTNNFLLNYSKSLNDSLSTGESNAYYFPNNTGKEKFLPNSIQFKYVGKFPVVKDTIENYSQQDWKGNIAFNQYSVRSDGRQSAWYPILYDISNDRVFNKVKYNIELICSDCNTLYINGNKPIKLKSYNFKSDIPLELTLFCGNYDFSEMEGTYFLNSGLNDNEIKAFGKLIKSYKKFYAKKIKIPFEQSISFIQTTPTSKKNAWMFMSFPTIMSIDWQNGLKNVISSPSKNFYQQIIAHELGHYYFGAVKVLNSELGGVMNEGFAEFLSLQVIKNLIGKEFYKEQIKRKIKYLKNFSAIPFAKIKSNSDYNYNNRELYLYFYAPIILVAIEKEIGNEQMWKWLNTILTTSSEFTNYDFLISTLRQTLKNDKKLNILKTKYFDSNKSLENAINKINMR